EFGRQMRNVAVMVEYGVGPPGLLGLYEGIPLTQCQRLSGETVEGPALFTVALCDRSWLRAYCSGFLRNG
ncbi:MAG: hypothetical protein ACRDND_18960, partial [Streptosporangiaceae bacterium]